MDSLGRRGDDLHQFATKKRTNNRTTIPTLKANTAAGYYGLVKKELLYGAGLLSLEK